MFSNCNLAVLILVLTFQSQVHTGNVIGGKEVKAHSRPYMVLLERTLENNEKLFCGGFLISEDFVMTAAHCKAKSYLVFVGLHKYNENHHSHFSVEKHFPRQDFDETELTNDIMLLKMSSKVAWSNHVTPIVLADVQGSSLPNSCSVCGWGITSKGSFMSSTLMEGNVTLFENKLCIEQHAYCSKGEEGPSQGDSGGPLVCEDGKVYGVVSGSRTNDTYTLYKYTKILDYKEWIDFVIKHN